MPLPPTFLLDSCCALNLAASQKLEEILLTPIQGEMREFIVIEKVSDEARYLRRGGVGEDAETQEIIDWEQYFASGLLRRISLTGGEEEAFVKLAQNPAIDDGEARCLAVAALREWGFVSDDIPALKFAAAIPILGTPDLLKNWADERQIHEAVLSQTLRTIRDRSRYGPPRRHPLRSWWINAMGVDIR